jgi:hypothetical protein
MRSSNDQPLRPSEGNAADPQFRLPIVRNVEAGLLYLSNDLLSFGCGEPYRKKSLLGDQIWQPASSRPRVCGLRMMLRCPAGARHCECEAIHSATTQNTASYYLLQAYAVFQRAARETTDRPRAPPTISSRAPRIHQDAARVPPSGLSHSTPRLLSR